MQSPTLKRERGCSFVSGLELEFQAFELDIGAGLFGTLIDGAVLLVDELDGVGQAGGELLEVLGIDEDLVLLVVELRHVGVAADDFLALGEGEIHVAATVLLHIDIVDSLACLDGT